MIKIEYAREFRNLSGKTRQVCLALSYGFTEGGMKFLIKEEEGKVKVWVAYEGKKVVGWATLDKKHDIMLYVRKSHQRRGIGRKLHARAYTYLCRHVKENPAVYPHDKASYAFFNAMGYGFEVPGWAK